ncbi:hypothetical protein F9L16_17265 [Agarivorans sp. B2Z047]|uniref:hypothetical protein n=1 Tax=Agarivorans sp. B2Z047 TaxID=2652721 RepID=UPI00128E3C0C|nr:hypothetical protein [Agarivorans sp. B2Z047]MPW30738.1 hypothetical protein [Agarivorans sp. B2Z047]UQN42040.1 DUF4962 domain-containing protein [Agarivorans sp. B2Z047]
MIFQISKPLAHCIRVAALACSPLLLLACGGGGDEPSAQQQTPDTGGAAVAQAIVLRAGETNLAEGATSQLELDLVYDNGVTRNLTPFKLNWQCNSEAVSISESSYVTANSEGEANCSLAWSSLSLVVDFTVRSDEIIAESLTISPVSPVALTLNDQQALEVIASFNDGSQQAVSSDAQWLCDSNVVSINAQQLTAEQAGQATCSVTWQNLSADLEVVVSAPATLSSISINPAGPIDIPLASKQSLQVNASYSDGSVKASLSDVQWACDSSVVSVDAQQLLVTNQVGQAICTASWQGQQADIQVEVLAPAATNHKLSLASIEHLRFAGQDYSRFASWVDQAVDGNPGYGFSPTDAVYMYYLTQDKKYIELAIEDVEEQVVAAEALIAANDKPKTSFDSYLYVGDFISELAYVYDYGYDLLSDSQKTRWKNYAEQAIWNVWNHADAQWGGNSFPWSGWATTNPGNNYHFSFLKATMTWGLVDENETWLNLLRDDKLPKLVEYYAQFAGGGSREGTGYGVAQGKLFELYIIWRDSTGEDLSLESLHTKQTIDYWIHATTPDLTHFAPIGDQSRVSFPVLFDYHESLMQRAASLNIGSDAAKRGSWWLANNSVDPMRFGFNLHTTLLQQELNQIVPSDLLYYSSSAGHLFVRSSWDADATWLSAVAGIYDESHAHQDQGSFTLFKDEFLAVTQNIWSHSGIHQLSDQHNILRFEEAGEIIPQKRGTEGSMTHQVDGDVTTINMDLTGVYPAYDSITSWQREIRFSADQVMVTDQCVVADTVSTIWQINLPEEPIVQADGSIIAGNLKITPIAPATPSISIINWNDIDAVEYKEDRYRLDLEGGACNYQVQLDVLN